MYHVAIELSEFSLLNGYQSDEYVTIHFYKVFHGVSDDNAIPAPPIVDAERRLEWRFVI